MRIHKLVYESLIRIMIEHEESNELSRSDSAKLQNTLDFKHVFHGEGEEKENDVEKLIISYFSNVSMDSPMASFWLTYLEMVEILFLHYHSRLE